MSITPATPGHRDTDYGVLGNAPMPPFGHWHRLLAGIAPQGDTLLVCGIAADAVSNLSNYALARLLADGKLDTSFGDAGRCAGRFIEAQHAGLDAVVCLPDGRIAGLGWTSQSRGELAIPALAWFDLHGKELLAWQPLPAHPLHHHLTSNGSLTVAANRLLAISNLHAGTPDIVAGRVYCTDFEGNPGFSGGAYLDVLPNEPAVCLSGLVVAGDVFYVAGTVTSAQGASEGFVCRYHLRGELDEGFGESGICRFRVAGRGTQFTALGRRPEGALVIGGAVEVETPGTTHALLWQLTCDGEADLTFNAGQPLLEAFPYASSACWHSLTLQSDGRMVVVGGAGQLVYRRWMQDGSPDRSYSPSEAVIGAPAPWICLAQDRATLIGYNAVGDQGFAGSVLRLHA